MILETRDLRRLALFQAPSGNFVERRTESLEFVGRQRYDVTVLLQFTVPQVSDEDLVAKRLVIPLGNFPKARRPDFAVRDAQGSRLPTSLRQDRAYLLAALFVDSWRSLLVPFSNVNDQETLLRKVVIRMILGAIVSVIAEPAPSAYDNIDRISEVLARAVNGLEADSLLRTNIVSLLDADAFWTELRTLAPMTTPLAEMVGTPGQTYLLEATYSDQLEYENSNFLTLPRRLLPWLGLISYSIRREVANVGRSSSLWIAVSLPYGVEVLRYFWSYRSGLCVDTTAQDPASPEDAVIRTHDAVIGAARRRNANNQQPSELLIDAQLVPSAGTFTALCLSILTVFIATYIFQELPALRNEPSTRESFIGVAGLFAAAPAAIAGVLAYQGQAFARHVSRGPRVLVAGLAGISALLAVVVSLKEIGSFAKWLAYSTSIYAAFLAGIFFFVHFGPRWRKNECSRFTWLTKRTSPKWCRLNQTLSAGSWLVFWLFLCVVFARCQDVLQQQHFFTVHFPGNVWRAWWSWF